MQSNSNAGIIIYRETKLPKILSSLALPKLDVSITVKFDDRDINIFLFDCPVNGEKIDKKRYKLLSELVEKNKASFLVERFEAKVQSNVSPRKNELHYSQLLAEVRGIKQFAALIKLSQEHQDNLVGANIGFITADIDIQTMDMLTQEAANVMLYEGRTITDTMKAKLHNHFMEKKGISIIFEKDIYKVIESSSVIYTDDKADLKNFANALHNKILIGKNKDSAIRSIDNITLWTEQLNRNSIGNIPFLYNDEILAVIRYYNSKLDTIEFIKRLPYIYIDYK